MSVAQQPSIQTEFKFKDVKTERRIKKKSVTDKAGKKATEESILIEVDKGYFEKNFKDFELLKRLSKSLKAYNEGAVKYSRDLIAAEMKKDKKKRQYREYAVRIPNGTSRYDNITTRGTWATDKDGNIVPRLSYRVKSNSMFPGTSFMTEEKLSLLKSVNG